MRHLIERLDVVSGRRALVEAKVWGTKGLLDFGWQPFSREVEIGLGGEWWNGELSPHAGKTATFHHRKENVDDAYRPVFVAWEFAKDAVVVTITGGFLSDPATVTLGVRQVVSEAQAGGQPLSEDWRAANTWERTYLAQALMDFRGDVGDALVAYLEEHGYQAEKRATGTMVQVDFEPSGKRSRLLPDDFVPQPGQIQVSMNVEGVLTAMVTKDKRLLTSAPTPFKVSGMKARDAAMHILLAVADDLGTHF